MSLFLRQLRFELLKLFARKRTYMGFAAFLGLEALILMLLQLPGPKKMFKHSMIQHGLDFSHYFSGLTLAYVLISNIVFVLGSLYIALVCGDIISKEVEEGTMRMALSRPISRARILLLKYLTCVTYTIVLTVFIVVTSLALGVMYRGWGALLVVAPWDHLFSYYEPWPGLERFALGTIVLGFFMLTLATLGFMFSCFNMKPASATALTLTVFVGDTVLRNLPYFENIRDCFLTTHMTKWTQIFQRDIPWPMLLHSTLYLGAFDLLFLSIAALYFARRDFKS